MGIKRALISVGQLEHESGLRIPPDRSDKKSRVFDYDFLPFPANPDFPARSVHEGGKMALKCPDRALMRDGLTVGQPLAVAGQGQGFQIDVGFAQGLVHVHPVYPSSWVGEMARLIGTLAVK